MSWPFLLLWRNKDMHFWPCIYHWNGRNLSPETGCWLIFLFCSVSRLNWLVCLLESCSCVDAGRQGYCKIAHWFSAVGLGFVGDDFFKFRRQILLFSVGNTWNSRHLSSSHLAQLEGNLLMVLCKYPCMARLPVTVSNCFASDWLRALNTYLGYKRFLSPSKLSETVSLMRVWEKS